MAAKLRDLPALATLPLPANLTIEEVNDVAGVRDWLTTSMLVYGGAEKPATPEEYVAEERIGLGAQLPNRRWLARLAGVPVGTASIFLGAGVVGLYNVTTLPEARGQGIGAAVTLAALAAARDAGYHVGVLQSSPMGFPVYTRLGFREVCRIQSYVWEP
jgi:GNAT superfamily N-acetyltransferase